VWPRPCRGMGHNRLREGSSKSVWRLRSRGAAHPAARRRMLRVFFNGLPLTRIKVSLAPALYALVRAVDRRDERIIRCNGILYAVDLWDGLDFVRTLPHRGIVLAMTNAAQQLINSFEALPEDEKHQVLLQLLRRLMDTPYSAPSDEDLLHAADLVFQDYDRHETQQ
jgi:hypothetical protein